MLINSEVRHLVVHKMMVIVIANGNGLEHSNKYTNDIIDDKSNYRYHVCMDNVRN